MLVTDRPTLVTHCDISRQKPVLNPL
jgi:hypothetical protein